MARTLDLEKRKAILKAAKAIFIKDGYTAAKMSDIAAEAGVAPGTLYLYFENKEALAGAIGEEFFSRLIVQFVVILKKMKGPDDVNALIDRALLIAREDKILLAMMKERKSDAKAKYEYRQRFISQLAEALSELMSRGVIRHYDDIVMLADMVLSLMRRVIMSKAIFADADVARLRLSAVTVLQHVLFDDLVLAANRLVKTRRRAL